MTKEKLALAVIERLKQEYPDADCTLDYDQAWKLLVSVRLAAQCTDARAVLERARHATSTPACACCATSTTARCRMTLTHF